MLGAIIGDIIGSRFEFNNTDSPDFELFGSGASITDDTICTVALADAFLNNKPLAQTLQIWCRKYPHPQGGYGGRFAQWIFQDDPKPYNSYGNGSAMRVSSVPWIFGSITGTKLYAKESAMITHNHPEGIKGAVCIAHVIWYLRRCATLTTYRDGIAKTVEEYYPGWIDMEFSPGVFNETCQGTVPLCFQILSFSHSFEEAIRYAVAWGGDSDTIAAIVGSLAEPIWGIPDDIKEKAMEYIPLDMQTILSQFNTYTRMDKYKPIYYYEQKQSTGSR